MSDDVKLYPTAIVADVLGVRSATVSAMCASGRIGSVKSEGGRYSCSAAHVLAWVREHTPGGKFTPASAIVDALDHSEAQIRTIQAEKRAAGAANRTGYGKYPKAMSFAIGEKTLAAFRTVAKEQGTGCAAVLRDSVAAYLAKHNVVVAEDSEAELQQAA